MIKYKIIEIEESLYTEGGFFKIQDVRNPDVSQHAGYFSTFEKAEKALESLCWGERVAGDYEG